jgi:hypothetical protein
VSITRYEPDPKLIDIVLPRVQQRAVQTHLHAVLLLVDIAMRVPLRIPEEAARMRALAQELAAMGTPTWPPEPADGRELGDGLGLELNFE